MSTVGDIMSTVEGIQYTEEILWWKKVTGKQLNLYGNPGELNIPLCTRDIHHRHHGIPPVYRTPPSVLYSHYAG